MHIRNSLTFPKKAALYLATAFNETYRIEMVNDRPPFTRIGPKAPQFPVILSVPHAGRNYHPAMETMCKPSLSQLTVLEDRYADLLIQHAVSAGYTAIIAQTPRLWIDMNRAEDDLDPSELDYKTGIGKPISSKARGGLGLVPTRTQSLGRIWHNKLQKGDIEQRITNHHRPYHHALDDLIQTTARKFGGAVLLDVHSMPTLLHLDVPPAVVIGDRFGRSASHWVSDVISNCVERDFSYDVAVNTPYAGGHILERHAAPHRNIHAVQIEVDRKLYLNSLMLEPSQNISTIQKLVHSIAENVSDHFLRTIFAVAAE